LILGVDFYNIYLAFLHIKNLKTTLNKIFYFFRNLLFNIHKVSLIFRCLFHFCFSTDKQDLKSPDKKSDSSNEI
jgi:hypothetical protein